MIGKLVIISNKIKSVLKTQVQVYDTYWKFAFERQNILFKKINGFSSALTADPILSQFKFTNAYRASDRVSQFLIRNVIYKGSQEPRELFFRIILFKKFNRIETWEHLRNQMGGEITLKDYSFKQYDSLLLKLIQNGQRVYSAAYIMPSGKSSFNFQKKHQNNLQLIEMMNKNGLPDQIIEANGLKKIYELFLSYPTIGPFLAYQYAIDIGYSEMVDFDENEFVVPGPGAKEGVGKCFSDLGGYSESDIIRYMVDVQEMEFDRLGLKFQTLWGRPLKLIDCQNLFCEVAKYSRVSHPDVVGSSGRTRIKQKYKPNPLPIKYWFPPKWKINHLIKQLDQNSEKPLLDPS